MAGGKQAQLGASVEQHGGVTFRVWAPHAAHVAVAVPFVAYDTSNQVAMECNDDGIWSVTIPSAEPGQEYKYLITTASGEILTRNDPRARALTSSDTGASIIVANDFDWGDDIYMPKPRQEHVLYELHIGTFHRPDASTQGTFASAIEKLDYLANLGVTAIELMPVTSINSSYGWGYNVSNIFAVESSYGGRHGLMSFVRACHDRGIGVIADVVYNHFGQSDIWQFDGWSEHNRGGIYFYNDERGDTPWGGRPDFGRPEVRQFILDNIRMWFEEYRLDGLRLDSTSYFRNLDGNDDTARDIDSAWSLLQDMNELAHRLRPGALVIAEDSGSNAGVTLARDRGGVGVDAQWRLTFPEALYQAIGLTPRYPVDIKDELSQRYNDDAYARVIFSDSHDTAANGRTRLNNEVSPDSPSQYAERELLLANTVVLTAPGVPMLLQGQEFLQGGSFTDWRELDWEQVTTDAHVVEAHRDLIALRRNAFLTSAGLLGQSINLFHVNDSDRVLAYHRWNTGGVGDDVIVVLHFGDRDFPRYDISVPIPGVWSAVFTSTTSDSSEAIVEQHDHIVTLNIPRHSSVILIRES
jgi:1,4-alpha-glucan branching enzyme